MVLASMLGKRPTLVRYDLGVRGGWGEKRQRFSSEEELEQLEVVADKVGAWFVSNSSNLPKRKEALLHLLSSLCKISVTTDPLIVYYHLLLNGILTESGDEHVNVNKNFSTSLQGFILDGSGLSPTLSSEFCSTLTKVVAWCRTNKNPPKTKNSFMNALAQLCTTRQHVPATAILRILLKREYIFISGEGNVLYPKGTLHSLHSLHSPHSHYSARVH